MSTSKGGETQGIVSNIDYYKSQIAEEKKKIETLFDELMNEERYETKLKDLLNKIETRMRKCHEYLLEMKEEVKRLRKNEPLLYSRYNNQMKDLQNDMTKVLSRYKNSQKMLDPSQLIQPSMNVISSTRPKTHVIQDQKKQAAATAQKIEQQPIEVDSIVLDEEEEKRKKQEDMDFSIQEKNDRIANELFSEVDKIMREQQECVDRIKATANHVMDLSRECLELERQQQETISRIQSSLDELETNLGSASSELKNYFRNLEKNNCVILGTCVMLLLIIVMVVVALFSKKFFSLVKKKTPTKTVTPPITKNTTSIELVFKIMESL